MESKMEKLNLQEDTEKKDDPLKKVFEILPLDDLKNVRFVSQRWCDLAKNVFVQKSMLVLEFCAIHSKLPPWNFLTRSKLKFENVQIGKQLCPIFDEKEFGGQLGESVQHLIMKEGQKKHLSANFLLHFKQLISIYFEDWEDFLYFEIPEWIENIEIDTVAAVMVKSEKDKFEMTLKLPKLKTFTAKQVQRASEDTLWGNKGNEKQFGIISVPGDLKYHRLNIAPINFVKTQKLDYNDILGIVFLSKIIDPNDLIKLKNLQYLRLNESGGCVNFHSELLKFNNIKSLNIINLMNMMQELLLPGFAVEEPSCGTCIMNLAQICMNVENFSTITNHFVAKDYLNVIQKPLKKIELNKLNVILNTPASSKKFHNLQKIIIMGNIPPIPTADFVKFLKLCPTLKEIYLKKVSFNEIFMIEQQLPNLEKLDFEGFKGDLNSVGKLVNGLKEKFTKLRMLGKAQDSMNVPNKEKLAVVLYKKIPTLRRSFLMDFYEFCLETYKI